MGFTPELYRVTPLGNDMAKNMRENYDSLVGRLEEIGRLGHVMGIMHWDQEVIMPPGGAESRAGQLATLAGIIHEKTTDSSSEKWLDQLEDCPEAHFNAYEWCNIREARREYDRETKVPKELVQEIAELGSKGHQIWVQARKDNKFSDFTGVLTRLIELKKQWAHHINPDQHPYDVNMDVYERGFSMAQADPLFARLKSELIPLIKAIQESFYQPDCSFMAGHFPIKKQEQLGKKISSDIGFSFNQGRMDVSVHPFCGGGDATDVRITTRYREDNFVESLYAVIHETGHGLYEQGRMSELRSLPVSESLTTGIHESQSLFWERMIAQQKSFCSHYLDLFCETFPESLNGVDAQTFYEGINASKPSFIRVEADEVTYPMHVIIRYEIEKGLFDGTVAVDQLPEIWNNKMEEYLGVRPPSDRLGVLQDVHWSGGSFGYFPSYTLGAMYAVQFYNSLKKTNLNLEEEIERGNFSPIKNWLNKNIHSQGRLYSTEDLMRKVTGEPLNPEYFISYLKEKYHKIYRVNIGN